MNDVITTLIITALVATNAGLIGVFLMLRQQTMMGDAISHAVLPGIVLSFLVKAQLPASISSSGGLIILSGAILSGIMASFFITFLHEKLSIPYGASVGIGFSYFFALGHILQSKWTQQADLDLVCVLSGNLITAYRNLWIWQGSNMGPWPIYISGTLLLFNLTWLGLFLPRLLITSFDPQYASTIGIPTLSVIDTK